MQQKLRKIPLLCTMSLAGVLVLHASDGVVLAQTDTAAMFDVYTSDSATYSVMSAAEVAALLPVTWQVGETVVVISPSGGETVLVTGASVAGTQELQFNAGGIWTLTNTVQGTARVGVAWAVNGDGGVLAECGVPAAYGVDSQQPGPDRKTKRKDVLPISYSGDDWIGNASAVSSVNFIPPIGESTVLHLSGTGATPFTFDKEGVWTVRLEMMDGSVRVAAIGVNSGCMIVFR